MNENISTNVSAARYLVNSFELELKKMRRLKQRLTRALAMKRLKAEEWTRSILKLISCRLTVYDFRKLRIRQIAQSKMLPETT